MYVACWAALAGALLAGLIYNLQFRHSLHGVIHSIMNYQLIEIRGRYSVIIDSGDHMELVALDAITPSGAELADQIATMIRDAEGDMEFSFGPFITLAVDVFEELAGNTDRSVMGPAKIRAEHYAITYLGTDNVIQNY